MAAIDLSEKNFTASHPPHIIVRRVSLDEGDRFFSQPVSRPWKIQYIIANTGRGQATVFDGNATIIETSGHLPAIPPFDDEGNFLNTVELAAGQSTPHFLYLNQRDTVIFESATMSSDGGSTPRKLVYLFGYVQYRDAIGIVRRTAFCRRFEPVSRRFVAVDDGDYEYN